MTCISPAIRSNLTDIVINHFWLECIILLYLSILFQMNLSQASTILGYLCLVRLDSAYCFNLSSIHPTYPNEFKVPENRGTRTSHPLRKCINITVSDFVGEFIMKKQIRTRIWVCLRMQYAYHTWLFNMDYEISQNRRRIISSGVLWLFAKTSAKWTLFQWWTCSFSHTWPHWNTFSALNCVMICCSGDICICLYSNVKSRSIWGYIRVYRQDCSITGCEIINEKNCDHQGVICCSCLLAVRIGCASREWF